MRAQSLAWAPRPRAEERLCSLNVGSVVIPAGPATIHGKIASPKGLRVGLIVGGSIGWAGGHATLLAGLLTATGKSTAIGLGLGIPLLALGVSTYIAGMALRDGASIEVLPGVQPMAVVRLPMGGPNATRPLVTSDPAGLTLRVQF